MRRKIHHATYREHDSYYSGGSGIVRGLDKAFHAQGNQVVIADRRKEVLDETVAANPGMKTALLDITDGQAIRSFAEKAIRDFPHLNVVIQNAGIMRSEVLQKGNVADAEAIVTTNLLGPIRLTAALLPHLLKQRSAAIMTVSSGLAFVPMAMIPTYCATKAGNPFPHTNVAVPAQGHQHTGPRTHSSIRPKWSLWARARRKTQTPCR
jgi:short-subunit dehydrogenase involved in D-alanine esterification of teichoic acids